MQRIDLEVRTRVLPLAVGERQACLHFSLSETSGLSANARWSAESGREQSGSGIVTRSESLGNLKRRGRVGLEGHAPERDDVKSEERVRRRRVRL